jgi:hypothetical protein
MGDIDRRINRLECLMSNPVDAQREAAWPTHVEILDEYAALLAARGGDDPVAEALGHPYTHGAVISFSIRRVFERKISEDLTPVEAERLIEEWTEHYKDAYVGEDYWNGVEMTGPPEPTLLWRGGI